MMMKMEMNEMIEKISQLELAIQNSWVGNSLEYLDVACTLGTPFQAAWALQGQYQECAFSGGCTGIIAQIY
jgi:hypothetical protein